MPVGEDDHPVGVARGERAGRGATIAPFPSRTNPLTRFMISSWWATSRLDVGSSSKRTSAGLRAMARAMCTRWRSPPESSDTGRASKSRVPVTSRARATASRSEARSGSKRPRCGAFGPSSRALGR